MPVRAQVVPFTAFDSGIGPGTTPVNSNAEAAQFDAAASALGSESLITFESAPTGAFTSLTAAPGVTLTGADVNGSSQNVFSVPTTPVFPARGGFNTTAGGTNFVGLFGGTLTFTFAAPVQAFGAYFTGIQPGSVQDTVGFSDGTSQSVSIPQGTPILGGVSFAGFTDAGKSIRSITITASANNVFDVIGIDDVRFVPASPVPEASTTVSLGLLLALGLGGLVVAGRRRKA